MLANNFKINNSELSFLHNIMHQPCAPVSNKTKCIHFKPLFSLEIPYVFLNQKLYPK